MAMIRIVVPLSDKCLFRRCSGRIKDVSPDPDRHKFVCDECRWQWHIFPILEQDPIMFDESDIDMWISILISDECPDCEKEKLKRSKEERGKVDCQNCGRYWYGRAQWGRRPRRTVKRISTLLD